MGYMKVMLFYVVGLICGILTLSMMVNPSFGWIPTVLSGLVTVFFLYFAEPATSSDVKKVAQAVKSKKEEKPTSPKTPRNSALSTNDSGRLIYQIPPVRKTTAGYIINPDTTFPLTLITDSEEVALAVRERIDHYEHGDWLEKPPLAPILARYQVRCLEVDTYIKTYKKQFKTRIKSLIENSHEWESASTADQVYLRKELTDKAIAALPIRLSTDLVPLLEDLPNTQGLDEEIIRNHGEEAHSIYMLYAQHIGTSQHINTGSSTLNHQHFKKLLHTKLCLKGTDIPQSVLLQRLTMPDLIELISDCNIHEIAKDKADAISLLIPEKNLISKIEAILPLDELYYLIPPRGMEKKIAVLQKSWLYYEALSKLMKTTYSVSRINTFRLLTAPKEQNIRWEVKSCDDCNDCESLQLIYDKNPPQPPLHIGCQCLIYWHPT